jgi:hypothetical protein
LPYDITGLCKTPDLNVSSANSAEMRRISDPLLRICTADARPDTAIRCTG